MSKRLFLSQIFFSTPLLQSLQDVKQNDEIRQKQLQQEDLTFLRLSNEEIKLNSEEAVHKIEMLLKRKLESK